VGVVGVAATGQNAAQDSAAGAGLSVAGVVVAAGQNAASAAGVRVAAGQNATA
jgi:hypothetical protein